MFPTLQSFYDEIIRRLRADLFPSWGVNNYSGCRYRADEVPDCDRRCVAGILMANENYCSEYEGQLVNEIADAFDLPTGLTISDLTMLQKYHDTLPRKWTAQTKCKFLSRINSHPCFAQCERVSTL